MLSFTVLLGNHTLAVIKGKESYEILKESCADLFKQINNIIKKGLITVDGREVPIDMFLGGDYKSLGDPKLHSVAKKKFF